MCAYHVLVATDLTEDGLQILKDAPGVTTEVVPPSLPAVRDALAKADALIAREDVRVDAPLLEHAPKLKVIGRVGASLGGIDMESATGRGIIVTNTPGTNSVAAGELTLTLLLALTRKLIPAHNSL